jgi:hypothetical protein
MSFALPYRTALVVLSSVCLSLGFLSGAGTLEQAGSQKWSHEGLMNKQLPAHSTHRARLWVRNELFSWWGCQYQLAPSFSKAVQCLAFPRGLLSCSTLVLAFAALCCALPPQAEEKQSLHAFGHQFCPEGIQSALSCARIWGSLPNSVSHSPGGLADLLVWKQISDRAAQAGGRQRFCAPVCFVGPGLPRCLKQLSFYGSLHCITVGELSDTLRWRKICTSWWQSEVLCPHVLWQVQVLPDASRSLSFSALF